MSAVIFFLLELVQQLFYLEAKVNLQPKSKFILNDLIFALHIQLIIQRQIKPAKV